MKITRHAPAIRDHGHITLLLAIFISGCAIPGAETTEQARLESWRGSFKLKLYRPLKVSLRWLPDAAAISAASSRVTTGAAPVPPEVSTRDRWVTLAREVGRTDPRFTSLPERAGLFAISSSLRAALQLGLTGGQDSLNLTKAVLGNPFGSTARDSASNLYAECRSLASEDEDRYPGIGAGLVQVARRSGAELPAEHALFRLEDVNVEHLVLGSAWVLAGQLALALHELERVKQDTLGDLERSLLHVARIRLLTEIDCPRAARAELEALRANLRDRPPGWLSASKALRPGSDPVKVKDLIEGSLAVLELRLLRRSGQPEEARTLMARLSRDLGSRPTLGPVMHLLLAQESLLSLQLDPAMGELKKAAEAIPVESMRARLSALLARWPEPGDIQVDPARATDLASQLSGLLDELTMETLFSETLGPELMQGMRRFTGSLHEWLESMKASVPSRDQLEKDLRDWWGSTEP